MYLTFVENKEWKWYFDHRLVFEETDHEVSVFYFFLFSQPQELNGKK